MPVEIKELVIKTMVENASTEEAASKNNAALGEDFIEDIVAQCVDQVLEIMKDKNQR